MTYLSEVVHQSTKDAVYELFDSYGVSIQFSDLSESQQENINGFLGMIGFSGVQIKGNLSVWAATEIIEKTGNSNFDKTDWIAEIANQILGRIKNKLLRFDVELMMGIPTSIETGNLILNFIQRNVKKYRFTHGDGRQIVILLDTVFEDILVNESTKTADEAVEEGETLLF